MSNKQSGFFLKLRDLSNVNRFIAIIFSGVVIIAGFIVLTSLAATNYASIEPENATKTGAVVSLTDTAASSGRVLKFGSGVTTPLPEPDDSRCPPWPQFPDENCTGVPPGTQLTPSGSLIIREDNTVIDGLDIKGRVKIEANNVTIKNSRIIGTPNTGVFEATSGQNIKVIDTEIAMEGGVNTVSNYATIGVRGAASIEFIRINAYGGADIMKLSSNVTLRDSYLHDAFHPDGSHSDILQYSYRPGATFSNINIVHNRLMAYSPESGDIINAVLIRASNEITKDFLFEYNYVDGGNYTIYCPISELNENVVFRNNNFGRNFRYGTGGCPGSPYVDWDVATNVFADNGQPVKLP